MAYKNWSPLWLLLALCPLLLLLGHQFPSPALRTSPPATQADVAQEVSEGPKLVALTFDDGPKPKTTPKLLDGLDQRGVKATFFLIGKQVEEYPELVERMAASGHQIGIHTYDHVILTGLNQTDFDAQVGRTRQILYDLLGYDDFLLRPPYGESDDAVKKYADAPIILWSVDPEDWRDRNVQREVAHIVSHVQDGDLILLHDIYPESVDAALQVIDQFHQAGYVFVTVEELFAARGVTLENGEVYRNCPP